MRSLTIALYTEGITDRRFLPTIIQKTASAIVFERAHDLIEVQMPYLINDQIDTNGLNSAETILAAARFANNFHILAIHADADTQTRNQALETRFHPGKRLVQEAAETEKVCLGVLPVIPVRMTEAWMLADWETVLSEINNDPVALRTIKQATKLPARPRNVESIADPKQILNQAVRMAQEHLRHGRRRIGLGTLYEPSASNIRLERLEQVPAYQEFVRDLTDVLIAIRMIE
jgi:hypothetical protein